MTTTDTAVAEEKVIKPAADERATALGPGLLRFSSGAYLCPSRIEASARCLGPLAHWKLCDTFHLSGEGGEEERVLFLYPLPADAALLSLRIGEEQLFPGRLAVSPTEDLAEEMEIPLPDSSFLAEFGGESFPVLNLNLSTSCPDLLGQTSLSVEIEYACGLPTVDGRVLLQCPALIDAGFVSEPEFEYDLTVVVEDGNELVDEPVSDLALEQTLDGNSLILKGRFTEFEGPAAVSFRPGRTQMPVTRLRRSDEHFIFSIFPPTSIPASPQRRDIVFAVDASENIEPELYESVKTDLINVLQGLDENDRFALVTFGREIDGYDGGEFCEIDKVPEACEWLRETKPQGRADVQPLLVRIQSLPSHDDRQLCIFLLAGGHVGNEPSILRSLDFDQSDRRYYTIALGSSAKGAFLRRLALLTRGRWEVAENGECEAALLRLLGQTRALLAEVTFEELDGKNGVDAGKLVPSKMTSLTAQGPVHCLGLGSPSALRFRSKDETGVFFAGTVNAQSTDNPALAGVWAGQRVRELLDSVTLTTGATRKALKTEAMELASTAGILTEDTVLVLQTDSGLEVQFSALPACWSATEPKEKKNSVSSKESTAPFDWRKGLVAREGLFKGSKVGAPGDSAESSGRFGLRSKTGQSAETPGKPRLDRAVMSGITDDVDDTDLEGTVADEPVGSGENGVAISTPLEEVLAEDLREDSVENSVESSLEAPQESPTEPPSTSFETGSSEASLEAGSEEPTPEPVAEPAGEERPEESPQAVGLPPVQPVPETDETRVETVLSSHSVAAVPVEIPSEAAPVISLRVDPFCEGRTRLSAYSRQVEEYETRLALSALAGLPAELSPAGGELPRILAQTVAHLEKRGHFSQAVAVMGLLLEAHAGPEVEKKMESLLAAWAQSLAPDHLPEAIQILNLGLRVCRGSEELEVERLKKWEEWKDRSGDDARVEALLSRTPELPEDTEALYSRSQREIAGLRAHQEKLEAKVSELQSALTERLESLPVLLEQMVERTLGKTLERSLQTTVESVVSRIPAMPSAQPFAPTEEKEQSSASASAELNIPLPLEPIVDVSSPAARETDISSPVVPEVEVSSPDEVVAEVSPPMAPEVEALPVVEEPSLGLDIPLPSQIPSTAEKVEEAEPETSPADASPKVDEVAVSAHEPLEQTEARPGLAEEKSGESMVYNLEELTEMVMAEPRSEETRRAVESTLTEPKERINFFRDLVKSDKDQAHHSLSLARAYRAADQTKVAVVHYQKYLRTEKDAQAYLELARAYDELGKSNLSASARKAAEAYGGT